VNKPIPTGITDTRRQEIQGEPDEVSGLTQAEAMRRLAEEGPNELATSKSRGFVTIAVEVASEPMFLLLVAASTLYFAMGKLGDAVMLLASVLLVMIITILQERRTERWA
jgi:P-type Ca2+ transporter type 2C